MVAYSWQRKISATNTGLWRRSSTKYPLVSWMLEDFPVQLENIFNNASAGRVRRWSCQGNYAFYCRIAWWSTGTSILIAFLCLWYLQQVFSFFSSLSILIVFILLMLFKILTLIMNIRKEINGHVNLLLPAIAAQQPNDSFLQLIVHSPWKRQRKLVLQ